MNKKSEISDELARARILIGEGLYEDAKKILRRVVRGGHSATEANELLQNIFDAEVKQLLSFDGGRKLPPLAQSQAVEVSERDLLATIGHTDLRAVPDLFPSSIEYQRYIDRVLNNVLTLDPAQRIDMGVAHLEMGLYDAAQSIFETVERYNTQKIRGLYLLGLSLILGGKAVEATIRIEPVVRDPALSDSERVDLLYLMGMAFERLKDTKKAKDFYRRTHRLNPKYRDVADKIK